MSNVSSIVAVIIKILTYLGPLTGTLTLSTEVLFCHSSCNHPLHGWSGSATLSDWQDFDSRWRCFDGRRRLASITHWRTASPPRCPQLALSASRNVTRHHRRPPPTSGFRTPRPTSPLLSIRGAQPNPPAAVLARGPTELRLCTAGTHGWVNRAGQWWHYRCSYWVALNWNQHLVISL